jgi:hypothetical protein
LTGERPGVHERTVEAHSGTAEHPFCDQDTIGWVRMDDLEAVTRLRLLNREAAEGVAVLVWTWAVVAFDAVAVDFALLLFRKRNRPPDSIGLGPSLE